MTLYFGADSKEVQMLQRAISRDFLYDGSFREAVGFGECERVCHAQRAH